MPSTAEGLSFLPGALPEVALTCSVLFYVFEALIGNTQQALKHLDLSLMLLQRCQKASSPSTSKPDDIVPHLAALLSCLDVQASIYDQQRGPPRLILTSPSETSGAHSIVPETFVDVAQSEAVLLKLQNWVSRHLHINAKTKHKPLAEIPPEVLHERGVVEEQLQRYRIAVDKLYQGSEEKVAQRILLLRIQARMYHGILLQRFPCTSSGQSSSIIHPLSPLTVQCYPAPEDWIDTALSEMSILLDASSESPACRSRPFTLSTQLVGGLLHAGLKSTRQDTIETALALSQHPNLPSRDGLWDARATESAIRSLLAQVSAEQDAGDRVLFVSTLDESGQMV